MLMMQQDQKHPPWLVFVNRAPEDDPWLHLMVINPINGEASTMTDRVIEPDRLDQHDPGHRHITSPPSP